MTGIQTDFNPIKAIKTLRDNASAIEKIGGQIEAKRLELIKLMAELMDAEELARQEVFDQEIKASLVRDYIKLKTAKQQKVHDIMREELRSLENQRDILIEVNNCLKASFKIHELEAKNLNLPSNY